MNKSKQEPKTSHTPAPSEIMEALYFCRTYIPTVDRHPDFDAAIQYVRRAVYAHEELLALLKDIAHHLKINAEVFDVGDVGISRRIAEAITNAEGR